jgi:hypothetical protein
MKFREMIKQLLLCFLQLLVNVSGLRFAEAQFINSILQAQVVIGIFVQVVNVNIKCFAEIRMRLTTSREFNAHKLKLTGQS